MLVNVKRDQVPGESGLTGPLRVYGVPGHMEEGLPVSDFDRYLLPPSDDPRRSAASNLCVHDRITSRMIAAFTEFCKIVSPGVSQTVDALMKKVSEKLTDSEGVAKAVRERLEIWDIEDHEALPLPSEGLGSPPEGTDIHGKNAGDV
jgi:hypothetical protein